MKDKFRRAKQYVEDHKTVLSLGAGVLAGVTATTYVFVKHPLLPNIEVFVKETPEELAAAMEKIEDFHYLRINGKRGAIDLYAGINPEKFK